MRGCGGRRRSPGGEKRGHTRGPAGSRLRFRFSPLSFLTDPGPVVTRSFVSEAWRRARPGTPMALVSRPRAPLWLGRLSRRLCARHRACTGNMVRQRRFAVEMPDCSLTHFVLGDTAGHPDSRLAALLGPPGRSYALCVPLVPGTGCGPRVQAARMHQRLLLQLRRGPLQRCQLSKLLGYSPGDQKGEAQHGFLLRDPSDHPDTRRDLLQLLNSCQEAAHPQLAEFQADSQGLLWQRLWELQGDKQVQVDCACVLPAQEPLLHPLLPDLLNSAVFQDRDAARAVLEEVRKSSFPLGLSGAGWSAPGWSIKCFLPAWLVCSHS